MSVQGAIRSRKRDEKSKLDPENFRDELVKCINGCEDLSEVQSQLIKLGSTGGLEYHRYGQEFLDIFIAGGILDAGGAVKECSAGKADFCLFASDGSDDEIKEYMNALKAITAQFRYIGETLKDEELPKVIGFIRAFTIEERDKLATFIALLNAENLCPTDVLKKLFSSEALTKDDTAEKFMVTYFQAWLRNDTLQSLTAAFKKSGLDTRLEELFPANKRSFEYMRERFSQYEGLDNIITWQASVRKTSVKKELQQEVVAAIKEGKEADELIDMVNGTMQAQFLTPFKMVPVVFSAVFNSVNWNKKFDLMTDQALKQVNKYNKFLRAYTRTLPAQVALLGRLQMYCVENQAFMKIFCKIVLLMYKLDIVSEDAVLEWYNNPLSKGKSLLLPELEPMIKWLSTAEEED